MTQNVRNRETGVAKMRPVKFQKTLRMFDIRKCNKISSKVDMKKTL